MTQVILSHEGLKDLPEGTLVIDNEGDPATIWKDGSAVYTTSDENGDVTLADYIPNSLLYPFQPFRVVSRPLSAQHVVDLLKEGEK